MRRVRGFHHTQLSPEDIQLTPGLEHDCATAQRAQTYNVSRGHSHGEGFEMDLLRVFKRYWDAIKSVRISCDNSSIVA